MRFLVQPNPVVLDRARPPVRAFLAFAALLVVGWVASRAAHGALTPEGLARILETTPLPPDALPPAAAGLVRVARMAGMDVERMARTTVSGSLASLASRASADPARADELAGWVAHLVEWLRDERDDPPPADIPGL